MTLARLPNTVPVLAAPALAPDLHRITAEVAHGATLAQIISDTLPSLSRDLWPDLRVSLVTKDRMCLVPPTAYARVRPHPGVQVVILLPARGNTLRNILLVVVAVAASALGGPIGAWLAPGGGLFSGLATGLATAGLTVVGSLLVNALIPVQTDPVAEDQGVPASYSLAGFRNRARPDAPVPLILGRHRYAPPYAAMPYSEISGDDQYIRALFTFGHGPLSLSDLRLGDTPLGEFSDVSVEIREGREGDAPITLYPRQVLEDLANAELTRPLPRDSSGAVVQGPASEVPVVRYTASSATEASIILAFPSGLFHVDDTGDPLDLHVNIRIRQRLQGAGAWQDVAVLYILAQKRQSFFRQHSWTLPSRGRWEIEVTRMTDERDSTRLADTCVLAAVQSIRPEAPINTPEPLAVVAMRVKAGYELNGTVNSFNAVAHRQTRGWTGAGWAPGHPRNPAAAYLAMLQSPGNPFPVPDREIDLDQIADWSAWCDAQGLKYDRVHEQAETLLEALSAICAAGRATPRHDGARWGVVIDRPDGLIVDHISPRNSTQFKWDRPYFDPPDGLRVAFFDETNGYKRAEWNVPWPGHTGDVVLTEAFTLLGKTDPPEVYRETRRRMYELMNRPDSYSVVQEGIARSVTRGDHVSLSTPSLDRTHVAARVRSVNGPVIEIDEPLPSIDSAGLGLRFRAGLSEADTIGASQVIEIAAIEGCPHLLRARSAQVLPQPGDHVQIGRYTDGTRTVIVKSVEAGSDMSTVLNMVPAAPEIDALLASDPIPQWDGRVGDEIPVVLPPPPQPKITGVNTGSAGTGVPGGLMVRISEGQGSTATAWFRLEHRLAGGSNFAQVTVPAASGAAEALGYANGDLVELRAVAVSAGGQDSDATPIITVAIGAGDPGIPASIDPATIQVQGGAGQAVISFAVGNDPNLAQVQIYRAPSGDGLDTNLHASGPPIPAPPANTTAGIVDGGGGTLPAGSYDYYLEPLNSLGAAGPVSGPFAATVT